MASLKRIADYAGYLDMFVDDDDSAAAPSAKAMREYVEDRLQIVEKQMAVMARRLDHRAQHRSPWWSGAQDPPDPEFCDSWSGLMYLSHTREQLVRTLKRL